jgi:hypothetical protein
VTRKQFIDRQVKGADPMCSEEKDRFIRWQGITRDQLSAACNLVLGLATGLVAFDAMLLLDHKLSSCCASWFAIVSMLFLAASVASALLCSVSRLKDFRLTTEITRRRDKSDNDVEGLRAKTQVLGMFTWALFWSQLVFFGIGGGSGALAILIQVLQPQ